MMPMLGRIQDCAKWGLNLWALKARPARGEIWNVGDTISWAFRVNMRQKMWFDQTHRTLPSCATAMRQIAFVDIPLVGSCRIVSPPLHRMEGIAEHQMLGGLDSLKDDSAVNDVILKPKMIGCYWEICWDSGLINQTTVKNIFGFLFFCFVYHLSLGRVLISYIYNYTVYIYEHVYLCVFYCHCLFAPLCHLIELTRSYLNKLISVIC